MALMLVVVMGILMGRAGQSWTATMQREREDELLFRGLQIQRALQRWHQPAAGEHVATRLSDLKELLKDPRVPHTVRRLRQPYRDPVSRKDWILITDPSKGIVGVKPDSDDQPIRQNGFHRELEELAGKKRYRDWEFRYRPTAAAKTGPQTAVVPTAPVTRSSR